MKDLVVPGILVPLLAVTLLVAGDPATPLWEGLPPGPHPVGFKVLFLSDDSRGITPEDAVEDAYHGRPVRIMLWYPAERSVASRMPFSGYFDAAHGDARFEQYAAVLERNERGTATRQFSPPDEDDLFRRMMEATTLVFRDLPAAGGRFPLVLHSLGRNDFQQESTVLWEHLASHGYVVANVPQFGAGYESPRLGMDRDSVEIQSRDLEFALGALVRTGMVDGSRVAIMGHSAGAVAALIVAGRNPNIDAVVSLDGSISSEDGVGLLRGMGWDPPGRTIPILDLHARGKRGLDLSLLAEMHGEAVLHAAFGSGAPPRQATHFDFQNWPLYSRLVGVEDPRGAPFRDVETGVAFYLSACRLTRAFLDAFLSGDRMGRESLSQGKLPDGIPADLVELTGPAR